MIRSNLLKLDLQFFAEEPLVFSFDDFKAFAESNEDAQKFLQSQNQSAADKQLEAWKSNNLDKIKQETIKEYETAKKNKSPEQIELEKLKAEFEAERALRVTSDNKAYVAQQIASLNLDDSLKESVSSFMLTNLVSADSDFTKQAVEAFTGVLATINEKHAENIKTLEMGQAFGNKGHKQTPSPSDVKEDPMKALNEGLGQLLNL